MSTLEELVSKVPHDDVLTLGLPASVWSRLIEEVRAERPKHVLSTDEAAAQLGYSKAVWAKWAARGDIWAEVDGTRVEAWQDEEGARWRLPYVACEAHVARLRERATRNRTRLRGPRPRGPRAVQNAE